MTLLAALTLFVVVSSGNTCEQKQTNCPAKDAWTPPNDDLYSHTHSFPLNYTSLQGIGLRARQHFFPNQRDVDDIFRNNLSELEQAYLWHINNLRGFVNAQLPLVINHEDDQMYNIEHTRITTQNGFASVDFKISYRFYLQKWDFSLYTNLDFTVKANNRQPEILKEMKGLKESRLQKQLAYLRDVDSEKDVLRSTRTKTMLSITKDELDNTDPRKNAYLNLGFGWEQTNYYYNEISARFHDIQIQEAMWRRLANQHAVQNYRKLLQTFGTEVVNNPDDPYALHKISFTYDPAGGHRVSKPGAFLEGIAPKEMSSLNSNEYGYKMFAKSFIQVNPPIVVFENAQILCTQQERIKLQNKSKSMILEIDEILTSSPELHVILPGKDLKWPIYIKPGEEVEFIVLVVPEIVGLLNEAIYIPINKKYLYFLPVTLSASSNPLGLQPVFYTDVAVGQVIRHNLKMTVDPAKITGQSGDVEVIEIYKTESFIDLFWPNGKLINTELSDKSELTPKEFLTVPEGQTKNVFEVRFAAKEPGDHRAVVHIYTNQGILVRLPLYYHVTPDLLMFDPPIVDFGFVPFRFDMITIEVYAKVRTQGSEPLLLEDIYFPIDDERLDFSPGKWFDEEKAAKKRCDSCCCSEPSKFWFENQLKHVFSVAIKPYKFGMVDTKIQIKVKGRAGVEIVELPVVGYVSPDQQPLRSKAGSVRKEIYFNPKMIPEPIAVTDIGYTDVTEKKESPTTFFKNKNEHIPLDKMTVSPGNQIVELANTFTKPITDLSCPFTQYVIAVNSVGVFGKFADQNIEIRPTSMVTAVEKHEEIWEPLTNLLLGRPYHYQSPHVKHTNNGHNYFGLVANFTYFPMIAQIVDNRLICSVLEDFQPQRYQDCQSGIHIDFGQVGYFKQKTREVHITNPFNVPIEIINIQKLKRFDDLIVYSLGVFDSSLISNPVTQKLDQTKKKLPPQQVLPKLNTFDSHESFKAAWGKINLGAGQTLKLQFVVDGNSALQDKRKLSKNTFEIGFTMSPANIKSFRIQYSYEPVKGQLSVTPLKYDFAPQPLLYATVQQTELLFKSTFEGPVQIQSIHSTDQRIVPRVLTKVVTNSTMAVEAVSIMFDPGHIQPRHFSLSVQNKHSAEFVQRVSNTELIDSMQEMKLTDEMIRRSFLMDSPEMRERSFRSAQSVEGSATLTVFDIAAWRNKRFQVKLPPQLINGKWVKEIVEEINAKVTITTSLVEKIEVPVKAYILEPRIIPMKDIDFGKVQIGTQAYSDVTISNPFNHTIAIEFYIGRTFLKENHLQEVRAAEFAKEFDKARVKAIRTNDSIIEGSVPSNPTSGYALRYKEIIEEFKSSNKLSALQKMPHMKMYCERLEFKNYLQRKDSTHQELGQAQLELERAVREKLFEYTNIGFDQEEVKLLSLLFDGNEQVEDPTRLCYMVAELFTRNPKTQDRHETVWKQVENYYYKQLLEDINEEISNKNDRKSKEFVREFTADEKARGLKNNGIDGLTQDQINVLHEVDFQYFNDLINCTFASPYMSDEILRNWQNVTSLVAFPNLIESGSLPPLVSLFLPQTYARPFIKFYHWATALLQQNSEGFKESTDAAFGQRKGRSEVLYRQSRMQKSKGILSSYWNDFLEAKAKDQSLSPASALTRQFEIHSPELHEQFLFTNATDEPLSSIQNFYLNPFFAGRTTYLEPGQDFKFFDLVIFEPKVLPTSQQDLAMTLYVKTGSAVLQTINLTGQAIASLLEVEYVQKVVSAYSQEGAFSLQKHLKYETVGNVTASCNYLKEKHKRGQQLSVQFNGEEIILDTAAKLHKHLQCLDEKEALENVYDKIFMQGRNQQLISLRMEEADVAEWMRYPSIDDDSLSILHSLQPSLFRSVLNVLGLGKVLRSYKVLPDLPLPRDLYWHYNYDYKNQARAAGVAFHVNQLNSAFTWCRQQNGLYNDIEWLITLHNLGAQPIDFDLVALEDPLTGEVSCSQDGLKIDNCGAKSVKGANQLFLRVQFTSDFTLQSLRKNLIMRNAGWVQRIPINLEVDPKAIMLANQFSNFSLITFGFGSGDDFSIKMPALRFFIVFITVFVTFKLKFAIDLSSSLPSSAFPELKIQADTAQTIEVHPVLIEQAPAKSVQEQAIDQPVEKFKPRDNVLRKNHFKEQKAAVAEITIEHSKPKHIHQKWHTVDKADESAADSWRVEYSDKGTDSEDIVPGKRPKKVPRKVPKPTQPKRSKFDDAKNKSDVIEQQVEMSEKVSADGEPDAQTEVQVTDEPNSKQGSFVEAQQTPKVKPTTARLSKKEKKELEARKARHAQLKQQTEELELARIKEQALLAEIAEKERLKKLEMEIREAREQQERERYLADIKAAHEKRLAEEEMQRQRRVEIQRNEDEILSQVTWSRNPKASPSTQSDQNVASSHVEEDQGPANEQTIDPPNELIQPEINVQRSPQLAAQRDTVIAAVEMQKSDSEDTPESENDLNSFEDNPIVRQPVNQQDAVPEEPVQPITYVTPQPQKKEPIYMPKTSFAASSQEPEKSFRKVIYTPTAADQAPVQKQRATQSYSYLPKERSPKLEHQRNKQYEEPEEPRFNDRDYEQRQEYHGDYQRYKYEQPKKPDWGFDNWSQRLTERTDRREDRFYADSEELYYKERRMREAYDYQRKYDEKRAPQQDQARVNRATKKYDYGREPDPAWEQRNAAQYPVQEQKSSYDGRVGKYYARDFSQTDDQYYQKAQYYTSAKSSSYREPPQQIHRAGFRDSFTKEWRGQKNDSSDDQNFYKYKDELQGDSEYWRDYKAQVGAFRHQKVQKQVVERFERPIEPSYAQKSSAIQVPKKPSMQWQRIEKRINAAPSEQPVHHSMIEPDLRHPDEEFKDSRWNWDNPRIVNVEPDYYQDDQTSTVPIQAIKAKDPTASNRHQARSQFYQPLDEEILPKLKQESEQQEQQKQQQTRQESSKKNFIDAFRSVKNIFSNNQPSVHLQEEEEPIKSQSIFGGSMGLFTTPTDSADSFMSSVFGYDRSDYGIKSSNNPSDTVAQRPQTLGYDRPVDRLGYLYREPEVVQPQSQRYDPLNFQYLPSYYQQQPQVQPSPMPEPLPLAKQPSTLEALRKASRPLHDSSVEISAESTPIAQDVAKQEHATDADQPQDQEYNFQFKQLKPFNPNSFLRMLEKNANTRNENNRDE